MNTTQDICSSNRDCPSNLSDDTQLHAVKKCYNSSDVNESGNRDSMLEEELIHSLITNTINSDLNESEDRLRETEKEGKRVVFAHRCILMARCELLPACLKMEWLNHFKENFKKV